MKSNMLTKAKIEQLPEGDYEVTVVFYYQGTKSESPPVIRHLETLTEAFEWVKYTDDIKRDCSG